MPNDPTDPEEAPAEELAKDIPRDPNLPQTNIPVKAVKPKQTPAQAEQDKQDTGFRRIVFWSVLIALGLSYLSTGAMMWKYLSAVDYRPDRTIMTAWISASVVQLIGLLYIITRSLFPPKL